MVRLIIHVDLDELLVLLQGVHDSAGCENVIDLNVVEGQFSCEVLVGKGISLFVNGDIPYVRVGSSESLAHEDAEATAVLKVLMEAFTVKAGTAAAARAVPGETDDEEEGVAHDRPPDPDPHEVPGEEVPVAEAARPPDPPRGGVGEVHLHDDDDEKEIEVEGEGAPTKKAKIGTLTAEANTRAFVHPSLSEPVL